MSEEIRYIEKIGDLCLKLEVLRAELAELREANWWIPVGERLPEDSNPVLVVVPAGFVSTSFYRRSNGTWHTWDGITHWRPLPSPPEVTE